MQHRSSPFMKTLGYGYLALFFFAFGFAPILIISFAYDWFIETTGVTTTGYISNILPCSRAYAGRVLLQIDFSDPNYIEHEASSGCVTNQYHVAERVSIYYLSWAPGLILTSEESGSGHGPLLLGSLLGEVIFTSITMTYSRVARTSTTAHRPAMPLFTLPRQRANLPMTRTLRTQSRRR